MNLNFIKKFYNLEMNKFNITIIPNIKKILSLEFNDNFFLGSI